MYDDYRKRRERLARELMPKHHPRLEHWGAGRRIRRAWCDFITASSLRDVDSNDIRPPAQRSK